MIFGSNPGTRSWGLGMDNELGTVRLSLLQVSQYQGKARAMRHRTDPHPTLNSSGGAENTVKPDTAGVSLEMLFFFVTLREICTLKKTAPVTKQQPLNCVPSSLSNGEV